MKQSRLLLLILGILLIVMGGMLFAPALAGSPVIAYIACILMILLGLTEIGYNIFNNDNQAVSSWLLADGIITAVFGILLLFVSGSQILGMEVVFAVWVLFTGAIRTAASCASKDAKPSGWDWMLTVGIIGLVLGVFLLFDPLLALMAIGFLMPVSFLMQGLSALAVSLTLTDE